MFVTIIIFAILHLKHIEAIALNPALKTGNFCNGKISKMLTSIGVGSLIVARYTSTKGQ